MTEEAAPSSTEVGLAVEIVSAYVSRNSIPVAELPSLIRSVHETLTGLGSAPAEQPAPEPLRPAVPIRRSVTEDYIISLEDGRRLKSMKRYLAGLGMTPAEYRIKWSLPADYPMVAPAYAAQRSALAKTLGLGRKPAPQPGAAHTDASEPPPAKPKRGKVA